VFPIHFKLTVSTPAELAAVSAFVAQHYGTAVANAPKLAEPEVAAALVEKPKKASTAAAAPASQASTPAPSPRTAEAAAETAAPAKTVAASSPTAAPAEAAPQASTAAEPFAYSTLQALVFKLLPDHGAALLDISKKHGAAKFKELPADKWRAAYDDLVATYGG
jgi:hypothetical protein